MGARDERKSRENETFASPARTKHESQLLAVLRPHARQSEQSRPVWAPVELLDLVLILFVSCLRKRPHGLGAATEPPSRNIGPHGSALPHATGLGCRSLNNMAPFSVLVLLLIASASALAASIRSLPTQSFTTFNNAGFPSHALRIKKSSFCDPTVNVYTGWLDIGAGGKATKHLWFYFFESRSDPVHDPVVMWINGVSVVCESPSLCCTKTRRRALGVLQLWAHS